MKHALVFLFLWSAATAALGQSEERPKVPEPAPRAPPPQKTQALILLNYPQARNGVDRFMVALPELIRFFTQHTRFHVGLRWYDASLDDRRLDGALLLYLTGGSKVQLDFTEGQKTRLGEYLRRGGLLFAEDLVGGTRGTPFDSQLKALLREPQVLGRQGRGWKQIPNDHPLYHSYFEFKAGPPLGGVGAGGNVSYLEMLELRGRVAVIFSNLDLTSYWSQDRASGRDRALQFGVNLIVFAMAQRAAQKLTPGVR